MKALKVGLAIGIAILLPLLANMTVRIWSEPPEYPDYHTYYNAEAKTAQERDAAEKQRREQQDRFDAATEDFNTQSFYMTFPIGVFALGLGFLLRARPTLAAGTFFGGLGTIAFASFESWETLPGLLRYVALLATLLILAVLSILVERKDKVASG